MSLQRDELESLSRAFAARSQSSTQQCPEPQRLFEAASGELDREQRMQILDHVSECAQCAEAWRIAMEIGVRPATSVSRTPAGAWKFATAASVIVSVGLLAYVGLREGGDTPQYRDATGSTAPVSLSADRLPRGRFLLQWSPGPAGSTYAVRLSTASLVVLLAREDIGVTELLIPSAVLANVRSGEQLFWQVDARLPDGSRLTSGTYVVTLQ